MNQTPIIKTLWIGGSLSRLEYVCLKSFLVAGHEVHLYVYEDVKNIPEGVIVLDANEVVDKSEIFTYGSVAGKGKGSVAGFANYFRYKMLYESSNSFWVDADVICLKKFEINSEIIAGYESVDFINNAVIGVKEANHYLFNDLVSYCKNPYALKKWDSIKQIIKKLIARTIGKKNMSFLPWGTTGPKALTGFMKKYSIEACPVKDFYPIASLEWRDIFFNEANFSKLNDSYAIHLWNEQLRREGIDKNSIFDERSLYESLIKKLNIDYETET